MLDTFFILEKHQVTVSSINRRKPPKTTRDYQTPFIRPLEQHSPKYFISQCVGVTRYSPAIFRRRPPLKINPSPPIFNFLQQSDYLSQFLIALLSSYGNCDRKIEELTHIDENYFSTEPSYE